MSHHREETVTVDYDLIQWKTHAWKDPGMVGWYSGRMKENTGTNYLKNALETGIIRRQLRGKDIIDIGIGTGRAALPLIAKGYQVTGVDSSQAMLNEARRLAGDLPITLKLGDITRLPCEDVAFDSAVALNVLVHFPSWREALCEWKRVVRPGGRVIFDIHSLDHIHAAYGHDMTQWPEALNGNAQAQGNFVDYLSRMSTKELVSFANDAGFAIVAAIPYGAFLGGGNVNWLLYESLERSHKWRRVLSWFSRDAHLFEMGLFLEEMVVSCLSPRITGRMFVVLENRADPEGNARWEADLMAKEEAMAKHTFSALLPWLPLPVNVFERELARLLQPLRSRHFFYLLLKTLVTRYPTYDFSGVLPEDYVQQFSTWWANDITDERALALARGWSDGCHTKYYQGVDVTRGIEYHLVEALLKKHYRIFGEGPQ